MITAGQLNPLSRTITLLPVSAGHDSDRTPRPTHTKAGVLGILTTRHRSLSSPGIGETDPRHRPTPLLYERQSVRSYPSHAARLPSWYLTQEIWTGVGKREDSLQALLNDRREDSASYGIDLFRTGTPRVGGKDQGRLADWIEPVGTPPRRRGGRLQDLGGAPLFRNTPASAGRTLAGPRWGAAVPEHPRVGGEDEIDEDAADLADETPPRRRGGPLVLDVHAEPSRSTPASAGRTRASFSTVR